VAECYVEGNICMDRKSCFWIKNLKQ
jgi:hypothetical protein